MTEQFDAIVIGAGHAGVSNGVNGVNNTSV